MEFIRHILRVCVVMLLSAFGADMAFAVPTTTSDISYFQTETTHFARGDDVGFAARAPPLAVPNVAVTGCVTVMQGSAFTLHGQETAAALFAFNIDLPAPNNGASLPTPVVVSNMPNELTYTTSSGVKLVADPNRTTTVLGNYGQDMQHVLSELDYPKTLDFGSKDGGFNVLNTPDSLYTSPTQFWNDYNQPFLDAAITRGDNFPLATAPTPNVLSNDNGLTGFGREIEYLQSHGYTYDAATSSMVK